MIKCIVGDATEPIGDGPKVIFHIVNDQGAWGKGFVLSLSSKWPEARSQYLDWRDGNDRNTLVPLEMGEVQIVPVEEDIWVLNMCAQTLGYKNGRPPIRYEKLNECLRKAAQFCKLIDASAHAPKIGTGLAGGDWDIIKPMIEKCLSGIDITIYEQ